MMFLVGWVAFWCTLGFAYRVARGRWQAPRREVEPPADNVVPFTRHA